MRNLPTDVVIEYMVDAGYLERMIVRSGHLWWKKEQRRYRLGAMPPTTEHPIVVGVWDSLYADMIERF